MKKISTLMILTCSCLALYGQTAPGAQGLKEKARQISMLNEQSTGAVAKTTAIKQRLIGSSTIDAQMQVADSMMYRYSSGRGSEFDRSYLYFSELFNSSPGVGQGMILCDSSYELIAGKSKTATTYNSAGMPTGQVVYNGGPLYRYTWTYNSQNLVTESVMENYNSIAMSWLPTFRVSYVYDAQGKRLADTASSYFAGNWQYSYGTVYHYNSAGLVDTSNDYFYSAGSWILNGRLSLAYTGTQMTSMLMESYTGGVWQNDRKTDITYAGSQKVTETSDEWISSNWSLVSEEYRHLNGNNQPDSVFSRRLVATSWDTTISKLVFNSFDNPVSIDYYDGSMGFIEHERYTYQDYDPQGVTDVKTVKSVTVYPNPAKEQLHIAASGMQPGTIRYIVTNSLGQTVMSGSGVTGNDKVTMDIDQLLPGMYWLQMQDAAGERYAAGFAVE